MDKYAQMARDYVSNPANKQVVSIATGVAVGIVAAPLMFKALGATAIGLTAKAGISLAVGAGVGTVASKVVDRKYNQQRVVVALLNS